MSERRFPWRTLLFVSLAFNLLIVGAAIGAKAAGVRLEREEQAAGLQRAPAPRAFMRALSPQARTAVRADLVRAWFSSRDLRARSREARRALYQAAGEEPYDAGKVRAAFAAVRAADQATLAAFHDAIADSFGKLDAAERKKALEAIVSAQRQPRPPGLRRAREDAP
jgi:uncharacterized membrane protein